MQRSTKEAAWSGMTIILMIVIGIIFGFVLAQLWISDAEAAVTPEKQPVVGYAYTTSCVSVGKPAKVHFVLKNQSTKMQTIVVWHYGIGVIAEDSQKGGPMLDADTARSGLIPTTLDYLWRWNLKLKSGQTVEKTLYVNKVPPSFLPPESEWDPAWGPRPIDRTVFGAIANVKYSTVVFGMDVWPAYCK